MTERSITSRTIANRTALDATNLTIAAVDALKSSGMHMIDIEEVLGLSAQWGLDRRHDRVSPHLFDEPPWFDPYDDGEESWWNPVDPWSRRSRPSDPAGIRRFLAAAGR